MQIIVNVKLAIDSDDLPEWARYLAIDHDGGVWAYDQRPTPVETRQGGAGAWLVNPRGKGVQKYQGHVISHLGSAIRFDGIQTITVANWQETGLSLRIGPDEDAPYAPYPLDPSRDDGEDCSCLAGRD